MHALALEAGVLPLGQPMAADKAKQSSRGALLAHSNVDAAPGPVPPLQLPLSPSSSAAAAAASSVADSSELMWEEQLRVAAVAVGELQQLVTQRRKGGSQQPAASRSHVQPDTGTLAYAALSASQADALTAHLLLTSNTLLQQLAQQWSAKRGGIAPAAVSSAQAQCHDPSPLPLSRADQCQCRRRACSSDGEQISADSSVLQPSPSPLYQVAQVQPQPSPNSAATAATSDASDNSPLPPTPSSPPSAPIRRTVLPFSNIGVLEKNIVGLRTARGHQLRSQRGQGGAPGTPGAGAASEGPVHVENGAEMAHPQDLALLRAHFTQLLTPQYSSTGRAAAAAAAASGPAPAPAPAVLFPALMHPYALMVNEFLTHWTHQLDYIRSENAQMQLASAQSAPAHAAAALSQSFGAAASSSSSTTAASDSAATPVPSGRITRAFLSAQLSALHSFLSSHETLVVLSYPHLHQTSLCRRVLRSALRSLLFNHPVVHQALEVWFGVVYAEEDEELRNKIAAMRHVSLREIGLQFPYTLCAAPLIPPEERLGEGVVGEGASSLLRHPHPHPGLALAMASDDEAEAEEEEEEMGHEGAPVDQLIHSDEEGHGGQSHARRSSISAAAAAAQPRHRARAGSVHCGTGMATAGGTRRNSAISAASSLLSPGARLHAVGLVSAHGSASDLSLLQVTRGLSDTSLASEGGGDGANGEGSGETVAAAALHRSATPPPSFQPYSRSIALLSTLDSAASIDAKIDVLVSVCRSIAAEVRQFVEAHGVEDAMPSPAAAAAGAGVASPSSANGGGSGASGVFSLCADDLFQIAAYVLLHSKVSAPSATLSLLSECIESAALNGEEGYCLTTFECAVQLVLGWSEEGARQHADQVQAQAALHMGAHVRAASVTPPLGCFVDGAHSSSLPRSPSVSKLHLSTSFSSSSGGSPSPASASSQLSSPSRHHSGIGGAALSTLGTSPSSPDPSIYASQLATNLDSFCIACDYLEADSSWTWVALKDGVTILRKHYGLQSPIASIKGVAVVPRPPRVLQAFLKNPQNRVHIDEVFHTSRIVAHLSADTKIVNYQFRARNWCSRQRTDFLLLHHQSTCSDGVSLITLTFSVTHPACPPQAGFTRATVRPTGWLLKPTADGRSTHCTYLVAPDANGFPAFVVNLV
jgi:hypothetical protein